MGLVESGSTRQLFEDAAYPLQGGPERIQMEDLLDVIIATIRQTA